MGHGSVSQLAEAKRISRPAISQAVELLVEKGLIVRTQEAHDRRCIRLDLSQSGCDLLDSLFADTRSWMRTRLDRLSEAEMCQISQSMLSLQDAFTDKD